MKTSKTKSPVQKISRDCVVCGKKISILVNKNRTYTGGHFFGKLNIGKRKKAEYWECNRCYTNNIS